MRGKTLLIAFVFGCATLCASQPGLAASGTEDLIEQMQKEGWTLVSPSVLQRDLGNRQVETLGFGADGLRFKIDEMKNHLAFLKDELRLNPSPDLRKAVRAYRAEIARLTDELANAKVISEEEGLASMTENVGIDCTIKYGAHVNAFALSGGTAGVGATTDSYFNSNCGQTGEVYAHAYGKATGADNVIRTATQTDPASGVRSGGNVTANASVTVNGIRDCYSYSYATMTSYDIGVTYSQSTSNYACPNPLTLSVSSNYGSYFELSGYDCATVTWSAAAGGGTTPYSYAWYNGATYLGSGSTFSKTFCGNNVNSTQTYTVTANLTDSTTPTPQTKSASYTTTIYYYRYVADPCASTAGGDKIQQYPCN